jgi:RimJ/RimL family protein N-acetyltransferase
VTVPLKTERLIMKPIDWNDLHDIHALHSNPLVNKFSFQTEPKTLEESKAKAKPFIEAQNETPRSNFTFSIRELSSQKFVGLIGLTLSLNQFNMAEFFFQLSPNHWNKGYATEAGKAVVNFGFNNLNIHRIEANVTKGNEASIRVLEKLHFEQDALRRKIIPINNEWHDGYLYSILEE